MGDGDSASGVFRDLMSLLDRTKIRIITKKPVDKMLIKYSNGFGKFFGFSILLLYLNKLI
jgi:hypothetical protein